MLTPGSQEEFGEYLREAATELRQGVLWEDVPSPCQVPELLKMQAPYAAECSRPYITQGFWSLQ